MTRRVQRLHLSDRFLLELLTGERHVYRIVANALPPDAHLVDIRLDLWRGVVELLIASDSFPEVEAGNLPPVMPDPVFRSL